MRKVIGSSPISSTKKETTPNGVVFLFWYGIRDRTRTDLNAGRMSAARDGLTERNYDSIESYIVCYNTGLSLVEKERLFLFLGLNLLRREGIIAPNKFNILYVCFLG